MHVHGLLGCDATYNVSDAASYLKFRHMSTKLHDITSHKTISLYFPLQEPLISYLQSESGKNHAKQVALNSILSMMDVDI